MTGHELPVTSHGCLNLILSDEIDAGKSSYLMELRKRLISKGASVAGWITPAHMEDGKKTGHDFIALRGAIAEAPIPFTRTSPFAGSFAWRRFYFNRKAFERASVLADGIFRVPSPLPVRQAGESRVPIVFIMDEIGPLELEDQRGFILPFEHAITRGSVNVIVVRTSLCERISTFRGITPCQSFSLAETEAFEAALEGLMIRDTCKLSG
jgi:nucleoside-triphosphatase THEP1